MARKSSNISIVQFDSAGVSWLRARRTPKGIEVLEFEAARFDTHGDERELEAAMTDFVRSRGIANDHVYSILPRHSMTTRILMLPSHDFGEIEGMVRLNAEEYVPYPAHELVIDDCLLQKMSDGNSRVLAVYAHRDVVESHVSVLRACGAEPEHIFISTACLASAAIQARAAEDERVAVVNIASSGLEIIVLHGTRLEFARGVAAAIGAGAEDAIAELASEVRASVAAYRRESEEGYSVDRVFVCSDWADASKAAEALAAETGYDCTAARFATGLCSKGAEQVARTQSLVALGGALAAQDRAAVTVSLVPESVRRARRMAGLKSQFMKAGALAAAIIVSLLALYGNAAWQRTRYIHELQARIADIGPDANTVEVKRRQLLRLQEHLDRRGSALEMLARFSELAPGSGMNITRFSFTHGQGISISGRTESLTYLYELTDALREAGRNETPQFLRARQGTFKDELENDQPVIQYEILIPFVSEESGESESTVSTVSDTEGIE